jgi:hypothetical protein
MRWDDCCASDKGSPGLFSFRYFPDDVGITTHPREGRLDSGYREFNAETTGPTCYQSKAIRLWNISRYSSPLLSKSTGLLMKS